MLKTKGHTAVDAAQLTNGAGEDRGSSASLARRLARVLAARQRAADFVRRVPVETAADVVSIGDLGYGGYQLPGGLLGPDSVVLSAGAGTDVSFEAMIVAQFGCRVHLLDPVPAAAAHVAVALAHEPRITFEQAALWDADTRLEFHAPEVDGHVSHSATNMHDTSVAFVAQARSVKSLRAEHGWDHIDLLKISAEGSEFAILDCVLGTDEPITAIGVEFAQPVRVGRVQEAIAKLVGAGYVAVARSARPFNWKMTFLRTPELRQ